MTGIGRGMWLTGAAVVAALTAVVPAVGVASAGTDQAAATGSREKAEASDAKTDIYLGLYMLGSNPSTRPLKFETDPYPNTQIDGGLGGGLKVGAYPASTGKIIGFEGELYGFNGEVNAPTTTSGGVTRSARMRLNVFNVMANVLVRYPGRFIQPYIGAGVGLSGGFARSLNVQNSAVGTIGENAGDAAFAYQLIGGGRLHVSDRWFLFSEYKYVVANYKWESEIPNGAGGPSFSLPFRTHIISGGIGITF